MKFNIKPVLILMSAISVLGVGCLKDKDYDNGAIQSVHATGSTPKVVEIKLTANDTRNTHAYALDNSPNDTTIDLIVVNLAAADPAPQDLHVTLTQNDQIVTDYNAANTDTTVTPENPNPSGVVTHYLIPDPSKITIVNPVVVIPKGSHSAFLQVTFKPSDFLGPTYAIGFTISKVDENGYTISGNLQNGMAIINIKNQYDGNYHVSGVRVHPTLGPFPFDYDADLSTTSANSVDGAVLADLGEGLNITINPDNSVSLSGDSRAVFLQAGKQNDYDPATKTITLNYYYNTGAPRLINETLVRN